MKEIVAILTVSFFIYNNAETHVYALETPTTLSVAVERDTGVISFDDGMRVDMSEDSKVLFVDGNLINDVKIITVNNVAMIPIRTVSEIFDLELEYDAEKQLVTLGEGLDKLFFTVGSDEVNSRRQEFTLSNPVEIYDKTAYVPLRFIFEFYNYEVSYYAGTNEDNQGIIKGVSNIVLDKKEEPRLLEPMLKGTKLKITPNEIAPASLSVDNVQKQLNKKLLGVYDYFQSSELLYNSTDSDEAVNQLLEFIKTDLEGVKFVKQISTYMIFENTNRVIYDTNKELFYFEVSQEGNHYIFILESDNYKIFMTKYFEG